MAFSSFFFGRKQNSNNNRRSVKLNRNAVRTRTLSMEPLESRDLLSVTTGYISDSDYSALRAQYPDFNLPEEQSNLNVMTVDCNLSDLKSAISTARTTTESDLILVKTSASANSVTYTSNADEITIDIDSSQYGSVTIIGWGEENFTLNANKKSRGMSISGSSTVVNLGGLTITGGKSGSSYGGGIYNYYGTLVVTNCMFLENAAYSSGGGIFNNYGTLTITHSEISRNTGTARSLLGGGICNSNGSLTVTNCMISENTASSGGGIYNSSGTLSVTSSEISGNTASSYGGGIYYSSSNSTLTVANSTISGNTSSSSGGGIYYSSSNSILTVTNSTISGNTASSGGGVYFYSSSSAASTGVYNSIIACNIAGNSNDIDKKSGSIYGYNNLSSFTAWNNGTDNIVYDSSQPLFMDAENGDYSLSPDSQAIDKGNNQYANNAGMNETWSDMNGKPRFMSNSIDIGAYEFMRCATPVLYTPSVEDNVVSFTWSSVEHASRYQFEYKLLADSEWTVITDSGVSATFERDPNKTYIVRVKAFGGDDYADSLYTSMPIINYSVVRETYSEFNLPESENDINIIFVNLDDGDNLVDLKNAIATAGTTTLPDLILVLTSTSSNDITYTSSADEISISINASLYGSVTIIGWGEEKFTLDANQKSQGINITGSSTVVNLGSLSIINGNSSAGKSSYGGGIYNYYGTLTVTNSTISGNTASFSSSSGSASPSGGGIYNYSGTLTITNSTISGNTASFSSSSGSVSSGSGGGIYNYSGTLTITNSAILDNIASFAGGGIANTNGIVTVTNSTISGNNASTYGGGMHNCNNSGYNGTAILTVINSKILGNTSSGSGGGICNLSSYSFSNLILTLTNCEISGNTATGTTSASSFDGSGGGICNHYGTLTITSSTISRNTAIIGGGIYDDGTLAVINSTISGNTALGSSPSGGGIYNYSGTLTVTNSTISGNAAYSSGGGIFNNYGTLTITNSVISGNTSSSSGGGIYNSSGSLTVTNSLVGRNYNGNFYGNPPLVKFNQLGSYYPCFICPPQFDSNGNLTNVDTMDLHLRSDSIAIDKGVNTAVADNETDLDGNTRIFGGIVDIGAYEYQGDRNDEPIPYSTVVNTLNDSFDLTDNEWSLREAIYYAPEYVTITFADNLEGTIVLTLGQLDIEVPLAIYGDNRITIDADQKSRVFYVSAGTEETPVVLNGLTIQNGNASDGGGIHNYYGFLTITNSTISRNTASSGGGIYNYGSNSTLTITNSEISRNTASSNGGGIYNGRILTITNSTISGNTAYNGGGMYNDTSSATARVYNTIIACNTATNGNDVYKNGSSIYDYNSLSSYTAWDDGSDSIVYDPKLPLFIDAENGDYHLIAGSQAIDMGNNDFAVDTEGVALAYDLDGTPRIVNGTVDIGAYESDLQNLLAVPEFTLTAENAIVTVAWSAVTNASSYTVLYQIDGTDDWTTITGIHGTTTFFVGIAGMTYNVKIQANGSTFYADSEFSEVASITLAVPPTQLTGLTLSNYAPEVGTVITTILSPSDATVEYQWYCGSEIITGATASSFTVTAAQIGQTITCVATGTGNYTGTVSATTAVVPTLPLSTPSAPTLTVEGATITATWSAVNNSSSYTVEYQADGSDGWFVITGINGTTASFVGVAGTTYNVKVQANGTGNYSDSSYSESSSITLAVPPTALTALTLSTNSPVVGSTIIATLSPSDATVEYQWYCGSEIITGATASSFTVTEEQIGQTITCVATGTGDYTGSVSATTAVVPALPLDTPNAPTLTEEDTAVTVSWSTVTNASCYTVEYQADGSDGWFVITGINGTTTSFVGLAGTTYNVRVQANGTGNYSDSLFSESASIKLAVPPTLITGLTLSTTKPEVGTVITTTLSLSDATVEYQWYCGSERITGETASSFTVTTAHIGQTITCVATGTGNYTGSVSATTAVVPALPLNAPNAPTLTAEGTTITAEWLGVSNASSYTIEYQADGSDGWFVITGINGTTTSFIGTAGTTYNVRVQANGTGNYSDSSFSESSSITLAVPPIVLTGLTLSSDAPIVGTVITTTLAPSDATVDYQWYCGTTIIDKVTVSSFMVTESQIGQTITCVATGTGNYTGTVSATTAVVPALPLDTPAAPTLTAEETTITTEWLGVSNASSYTVEYQVDGSDGWFVITGINGTTTSFVGIAGTKYNVKVQANGTGNYSDSEFSESSSITLAVSPTALNGLTLSTTTPEVGTVLTAMLSPSDATVEYQWYCGSEKITGATASSFMVTSAQIGQTITCVATGTGNYTGSVSATTAVVPTLPLDAPNAPTLTVEDTLVSVTWSTVTNASSYTVQYQIDGADGWTTVTDILGTTTSFVGIAGTTYNVKVQANGTDNYSGSNYSEVASITLAVSPTTLSGLTLSTTTPEVGTVIATTLSPSDATVEYQWYCGTTIITGATESSLTVTESQIGQTITCVATGIGNYTGTVSAATAVVPALTLDTPDKPTLTVEDTTITATWSAVSNASSYTVEYQADGSDGWFVIKGINGTTTSFIGTSGTTYNVRVQANGTGNYSDSSFSESSSITLAVPPTTLSGLTLSTTTPEVGTVLTATLSPSDATVEYQWYCGSEIITGATASSFTVTEEQIGQTITCVATGTDNYTGTVSATTAVVPALPLGTPNAPTLIVEGTAITATWSAVSNASSYTVEYQVDGSDGWFVITGINGTTVSFVGVAGTTYNVRVQANGAGNYSDSSFSESASITLAVSPTQITGLVLSNYAPEVGSIITATLSPSDATVEYQWYCGTTIIDNATASSFTVTTAQIGQTITCVATGTGEYTGSVSATTAVVPAIPLDTPNVPTLTAEDTLVTATWSTVTNVSSYTVQYQIDGADGWTTVTDILGTTTSFVGLAGTMYNVRIQANGTGNYSDSSFSESVSITLAVPPTALTGLTLSTTTPEVGTTITAKLDQTGATADYQWYCGSEIITGSSASSFTVTAAQIGQTITCVATGTGNYTGSVSATTAVVPTLPLDTPNVPTLTVEDTTITATWSAINNASSYTVEYKFNSSDWLVLAITEETTALLIGQPGCEYSFRVKANGMSIYSDSDYSPIQTITTNDSVLVAQNDLVKTTLNNPVIIDYRENDNVMDWSLVSVQFGNALHGEYVVNEDGTIVYTPEDGFFGTDGFGYVLFSPSGKTSVGMISINVNLPIAPSVQTSSSAHNPTSEMAASVENMTDWDNCYIELWAEGVNELNAGETTITLEYNPAVYAAPVLSDCAEGASLSVSQSVLLPNGNIQVELTAQVLESLSSQTDNLFLGTVVLSPSSEVGAGVEDVLAPEPVCVLDGVSLAPTVEAMPYDLIRNGSVDVNDFVAFATVFGLNPNNLSPDNPVYAQAVMADFNNDGIVNVDDFILFATNYGATKKTATIPMAQASTTADSGNSEWSDEIQQTQNEIAVFEPVYEEQIQKPLPVAASSAPLLISENKSESSMTILEAYSAALLDLYGNQERADLSGVSDVLAETRVDASVANYSDDNLRKTSNDVVDAVLEEDLLAIDWN